MTSFRKEEIALAQLIDAIRLYNDERYLSAITLSGAAEEVIAVLLQQESKKRDIPMTTSEEIEQFLFGLPPLSIEAKNYHVQRSQIRNELKHHGKEWNQDVVKDDFARRALGHIASAIINYKLMNGTLPVDESIQQFCDIHGIN